MNTSTSVQVSRFKEPQIVAIEVTKRETVLSCSPFLKIECLELCNLWWCYLPSSHDTIFPSFVVQESKILLVLVVLSLNALACMLILRSTIRVLMVMTFLLLFFMVLLDGVLDWLNSISGFLQNLVKLDEWLDQLIVCLRLFNIKYFNVEGYWYAEVKHVLFHAVTMFLHFIE